MTPPVEEGLVIPTFGLDPEADSTVLPDFTPSTQGPAPSAKAPPTPTRFDPEGKGPRQGMGFLENLLGTFGSGTIEGALNEAEALRLARGGTPLPETTAIDQGSGFVPELDPEQAKALRDQARDAVFDQVAYDLAPIHVTPGSVAGSIAGRILAPSNLIGFGGGTIARGLAERGFGEAAQQAARFGAQASGTAAAVQDIRRASGARDEGGLSEQLLAGVAGSVLGAGTHAAGEALGRAAGRLGEFVRGRREQREALGVELPREAMAGGRPAGADEPAPQPTVPMEQPGRSAGLEATSTARTDPAAEPLRTVERAPHMPAAEPDPTAPVSREQAEGRAEPSPPEMEGQPAGSPDQSGAAAPQTAPTAPAEPFEARAARLSAEREAMKASGADAAPETRDVYEALGIAEEPRSIDPAAAAHQVDEALRLGRDDIADHIVEGAERRAVEAARVADEAGSSRYAQDTAGALRRRSRSGGCRASPFSRRQSAAARRG